MPTDSSLAPTPFHLLAKPTGAICNLDCKYCFFLSKEMLYPGSRFRMADELLETYIRQLLESQPGPEVIVGWQGGEPTLMGLEFFERSIECVRKHQRPHQRVTYTIQTNGTRLTDEWAVFLKKHQVLVGLSVDGPREMHDALRVDKGGKGTFDDVMRGWECLNRHGVDVNILCTVNAANADHPVELYKFFRDELKTTFIQFIPIVERTTPETLPLANAGWSERGSDPRPLYLLEGDQVTDRSVGAEQWGRFLIGVFDEWVKTDVGKVYVQMFDAALASWLGLPASMCIFSETCGSALALAHNGDLYSCDHFVEPKYKLGNITEVHMLQLVTSKQQLEFGRAKRDTLPKYCRECAVRFACHGECPRNRFIATPDGEPGLNYLCAGYKDFFTHIDRPMRLMADLLRQGRYADEAMAMLSN
ncbi:MAG TPA: anaerobic sulfatase maturase [Vicinamibacterales bacterium]|nr:anaerobic sulfatase maturase [Vicinamibacterales bacterium]